ncbi:MAG: hypothetical protein KAI24_22150 [Planctomycetes bacterium]|nr:hypothetical protein [Planctomycetota bacterium]
MRTSLWSLAALAACQSAPELPVGEGRGVLQVDERPDGAEVWAAPQWSVGDTFSLVRGEQLRGTFEVVAVDDGAYVIDMGEGRQLRRDLALGNLGEWRDGQPQRVMSPVDVRYHWPLWVGKRWQCEFVDRVLGGQALPMLASYHVEAMDRIEVPAGTFDALRIRRTLRLALPEAKGRFLTRTQMIWYAPEPGLEVRQLLGDTLVELVEHSK